MTQQQIEKAANAYIGHEPEFDEGVHVHAERLAFVNGARWRINSVWHDKHTVIPEVGRTALLELKDPNTHKIVYKIDTYCGEEWRGLTHYEHSGLVRFAYLDDLLPQRKEEE